MWSSVNRTGSVDMCEGRCIVVDDAAARERRAVRAKRAALHKVQNLTFYGPVLVM